jgi:hypothetical protein
MRNLRWLSPAVLSIAATLAALPQASAQPGRATHRLVVHHPESEIGEGVIHVAPPPAPAESRPPRPFQDAVWTAGYWSWNGNAHVWVDGAWVHAVPGRRWTPWRWEQSHGGWVLIPGGWVPSHEGHL